MRRIYELFTVAVFWVGHLGAQNPEIADVAAHFGKGVTAEELSPDDVESLEHLARHPVDINSGSGNTLSECGLFSSYQIASLRDYIERHGPIMSRVELQSVDGFSRDFVDSIYPFIRLGEDGSLSDYRSVRKFSYEMAVRGGYKAALDTDVGHQASASTKLKAELSDAASFMLSYNKPYGEPKFSFTNVGGSICWRHKYGKILAGDFHARFGQGLCLWNTMYMNTLASPSVLMRRPSGLSPSYSFTGTSSLTGMAADFVAGSWTMSISAILPDLKSFVKESEQFEVMPAFSLQRTCRSGHVSLTHVMNISSSRLIGVRIPTMRTSADFAICVRGVNLYGELLYDWVSVRPAGIAGLDFDVLEGFRLGLRAHYLPYSEDHGVVAAGEYVKGRHSLTFSADAIYHPCNERYKQERYQADFRSEWTWTLFDWMTLKTRLTERFRTWGERFRTDLRTDMSFGYGRFVSTLRLNLLKTSEVSALGYIEAGYKSGNLSVYVREGAFLADRWEDRIYVYERDAPGSFNVPAYYGRGVWTSLYLSLKIGRWGRLYARASYLSYPFMEIKKPGKAELKIVLSIRL